MKFPSSDLGSKSHLGSVIAFSLPVAQPSVDYERNLPEFGNPTTVPKSWKETTVYFRALPGLLSGMQQKHLCQMVIDRNRSIQGPGWGGDGWGGWESANDYLSCRLPLRGCRKQLEAHTGGGRPVP